MLVGPCLLFCLVVCVLPPLRLTGEMSVSAEFGVDSLATPQSLATARPHETV